MIPILESFYDAARNFEYDYIYIDAIFLSVWVLVLIKNKKWRALKAGIILGFLVYLIDAIIWWNLPAGENYPQGTFIREYWIGGIQMPHPLGDYFWLKFGADFMMIFSYSMFAFPWLWIMFENYKKRDLKEMTLYTSLFFGFWMVTPFISFGLPIDDTLVETVRHMDTQMYIWIVNAIIGYTFLGIIYSFKRFGNRDLKVIAYVLVLGCLESFFMEFPLFLSGIRPTGVEFLIYEILFLFNQGAPYAYVIWDKILPWLKNEVKPRLLKKSKEI